MQGDELILHLVVVGAGLCFVGLAIAGACVFRCWARQNVKRDPHVEPNFDEDPFGAEMHTGGLGRASAGKRGGQYSYGERGSLGRPSAGKRGSAATPTSEDRQSLVGRGPPLYSCDI